MKPQKVIIEIDEGFVEDAMDCSTAEAREFLAARESQIRCAAEAAVEREIEESFAAWMHLRDESLRDEAADRALHLMREGGY